jgi:hypothetical protein
MDAKNGAGDPSFKFSQSLEFGGFGEKVINELSDGWRCKKVGIDLDADRKDPKNQARLEFWSFTGVRMGDVTIKETAILNPGPLKAALKNYRLKNNEICAREIKRMNELLKAQEKAEKAAAAK